MKFALPVATIGGSLVSWELLIVYLQIPLYLLPKPSDFLFRFVAEYQLLWSHAAATGTVILGGFLLGAVIGIPLALLIVSNPAIERGLYPVIVFTNIIPKTITAPLFVIWFGTGSMPKMFLTMTMSFFPILVDSMSGFRAVDKRLYYISKSMGASPWQTFWRIRLPAAMPFVFSGMKIALIDAVTSAIVVEFIGSNEGLGYLILFSSGSFDLPLLFSAILATAIMGMVFNYALMSSERLLMPWLKHRAMS